MAIFAQQAGTGDGQSGSLRLKLSTDIPNGSTLVYNAKVGAFVDTLASGQAIVNGRTLGNDRAIGVFKDKKNSILEFRELRAGSGISLSQDESSITITSNAENGVLSVPGSYRITIDSHDATDDEARLELFTVRSAARNISVTSTVLPLVLSSAVHTGISIQGLGYFQAINDVDFHVRGFRPGMWVRVTNALNQSGVFRIGEILNQNVSGNQLSTLLLSHAFTPLQAFHLGGPKPGVIFEQLDVVVIKGEALPVPYDPDLPYRVASFSLDFGPNGMDFRPGMLVEILGSEDQDGTYVIAEVTPRGVDHYSTLLMDPETPFSAPPGPLAGEITFRVRETEVDTGFSVSEQGHLRATTGTFAKGMKITDPAYMAEFPNDVVTRAVLDTTVNSRTLRYFYANL